MNLLGDLKHINTTKDKPKPILLKIAPDLNEVQLQEIIEIVAETKIDGVIASNTSVNREGLKAGVYILKISTGDQIELTRLIVE